MDQLPKRSSFHITKPTSDQLTVDGRKVNPAKHGWYKSEFVRAAGKYAGGKYSQWYELDGPSEGNMYRSLKWAKEGSFEAPAHPIPTCANTVPPCIAALLTYVATCTNPGLMKYADSSSSSSAPSSNGTGRKRPRDAGETKGAAAHRDKRPSSDGGEDGEVVDDLL